MARRCLTGTIVLALFLVALPCRADTESMVKEARDLERKGDFKQAIAIYERLWQSNRSDENLKAALIWSWRQWNSRNPGDAEIVLGCGEELQRMKEYDLALHEYYWAESLSPQSTPRAEKLITGCYDDLRGEQRMLMKMVPGLHEWLIELKSRLEKQWRPGLHAGTFEIKVEFDTSGKVRRNEGRKSTADDSTVPVLLNQIDMGSLPGNLQVLDLECRFDYKTKAVELLVSGLGTQLECVVVEPLDSATLKKFLEEKGLQATP